MKNKWPLRVDLRHLTPDIATREVLLPLEHPDPAVVRARVLELEQFLLTLDGQFELSTRHHFSDGVYAREAFLPAGSLIVGKIHRHRHLSIITRGDVTTLTDDGVRRIIAHDRPVTFSTNAGMKRALYVHEDTTWTTFHLTNSQDLAEIEREIIAPDFASIGLAVADLRALT